MSLNVSFKYEVPKKVKYKQLEFSTKDSSATGVAKQMTPVHVPSGIRLLDRNEQYTVV